MNSRKCNVAAAYIVVATALCAVLVDIDELETRGSPENQWVLTTENTSRDY